MQTAVCMYLVEERGGLGGEHGDEWRESEREVKIREKSAELCFYN